MHRGRPAEALLPNADGNVDGAGLGNGSPNGGGSGRGRPNGGRDGQYYQPMNNNGPDRSALLDGN